MDLTGIFERLGDKLVDWVRAAILLLPNFVAAVLAVVVFWLLAKLARRAVSQTLGRFSSYTAVNHLLATCAYVAVLAAGVFVALGLLGLDKTVTSLLAGAGIIGLALAFAFQDIASNFMSGVLLSIRRPFEVGDLIETNDQFGPVQEINLRATHVRTPEGQIVILPNKNVLQNAIVNYSRTRRRRIDLACGVAYGDDLEEARRLAVEAVESLEVRDKSRDVELFYNEFGGSSINFELRFWMDFGAKQADYLAVQSEAIIAIKKAYDEAGITIPFPIRTLDFGVVGGVNLDEVLPRSLYEQNGASPDAQPAAPDAEAANS